MQAVLSGGLVFLAVFAERFFGFQLGRRQWVGVTITAAGLVVIGLTGGGANDPERASLAALIAVEGAIFASGAMLVRISARRHLLARAEGLILGAAAGALFGVSAVAIKYITQASPGPLLGLVSPWTLTAMIAGVIAFYASARSLQIGDGVEVIALTSVTANLIAIFGGIVIFHDPIGSGPPGIAARFLAFSSSPVPRSCQPRCAPPPTRASTPSRATSRQHPAASPSPTTTAARAREHPRANGRADPASESSCSRAVGDVTRSGDPRKRNRNVCGDDSRRDNPGASRDLPGTTGLLTDPQSRRVS